MPNRESLKIAPDKCSNTREQAANRRQQLARANAETALEIVRALTQPLPHRPPNTPAVDPFATHLL